jgi:hypothetical protein
MRVVPLLSIVTHRHPHVCVLWIFGGLCVQFEGC